MITQVAGWQVGHAVASRVLMSWSLDFNWTPLYIHIQGVTGGTDQTSEECSLGQTIPI